MKVQKILIPDQMRSAAGDHVIYFPIGTSCSLEMKAIKDCISQQTFFAQQQCLGSDSEKTQFPTTRQKEKLATAKHNAPI